jgi:hypothetical protein
MSVTTSTASKASACRPRRADASTNSTTEWGGQPEFVRVLTASPGCLVGLVVPAQPVVEHGCRPIGVGQDLRLPAQEEVVRERVDRVAGRGLVAFPRFEEQLGVRRQEGGTGRLADRDDLHAE